MAAFLVRGKHGAAFVPPAASGAVFADVPASHWAAAYIEQLHADGLTTGCGQDPLRYCPEQQLLRSEMAVFLLRLKHGAAYDPPAGTGTVFTRRAGELLGGGLDRAALRGGDHDRVRRRARTARTSRCRARRWRCSSSAPSA